MLCNICPRQCNVDRNINPGFCGAGDMFRVARAAPHFGEEPCISGTNGSGTVFFSGCNLKCVYCQNETISHGLYGKDISDKNLMKIFDNLIEKGVHNINLVTPSHYALKLAKVLKEYNSPVPVVYNTSSYEKADTLKYLEGLVDIYLADIKYYDESVSNKYSGVKDYFAVASEAVREMYRQAGDIVLKDDGTAERGLIIRHMVLPGNVSQVYKIFSLVREDVSPDCYISLMSQYTPCAGSSKFSEINRRISSREYSIAKEQILKLGFENVYFQKLSSGTDEYIPDFNLEGVDLSVKK